ncbi:hypothetical protein SAMN05192539_10808 [Paraburkholderia diazotrophica]|uniref:Uncharacterized protein n=1 Tax=Paraburkholderia diazotrophica TaxID=667676 RepID=A0A1H7EQP8_9BURK|nr:hypothetical protein SAMN05192539_10808 [Paraburkholderia diazotrophica]
MGNAGTQRPLRTRPALAFRQKANAMVAVGRLWKREERRGALGELMARSTQRRRLARPQ